MKKSVFPCVQWVVLLSLLSFTGCYSTVEVGDSPADKAISIDWVDPLCAEPGSPAGYIEGNGFGAENVTVTVGGIEAEVLAATGKDASFIVPAEGLSPGETIEVVVMNPGGRLATIQWVVCGFDCSAIDCDDGNECTTDTCDPSVEECVHTPVGDGVACDFDGLPGLCIDGACEEDLCTDVDCEDGDPCTVDGCNPLNGICSHVNTCGDGDPPVLTDLDLNPRSVDVSTQAQDVTCTMTLTDSPAGVDYVQCFIASPSGAALQSCGALIPSSGDDFNGVFECNITVPQYAEGGTWNVDRVRPYDTAGNSQSYRTADLQSLGFSTDLTVTSSGGGDGDPPVLTDLDLNPRSVDVSTQAQDVTCTMTLTDSPAGVDYVQCFIASPSGAALQSCGALIPSSGDDFNGVFECNITVPQYAEGGTWNVDRVRPYDTAGNSQSYRTADLQSLGFSTDLTVTSSGGGDGDPPVLTDLDLNPRSVDVSTQAQDVTCTMTLTDSPAGVDYVQCFIASPSGAALQSCGALIPSSGDDFNGVFECNITVPQYAEGGTWNVDRVRPYDTAGNSQSYRTADLQSLGFSTDLTVASSGGGDGDPPVITDFDFNPKNVDVANGPATITQTISVTDSPAGVDFVQCYWESPSGAVSTTPISTTPSSGDRFNGVFECVQTIPQGAAPGVWTVFTLRLTDTVGNQAVYYTADLDALGFPTQLDVTSSGGGDGDPPVITDFDFNPKNVDVANGPATITQTISVTDSPAGVDFVQCYWESPSGAVSTTPISTTPSSGDRFNGVFECVQTIPQGAAPGVWTVFTLRLTDTVGNQAVYYTADLDALGFPTQLDVTSSGGGDGDPPVITDFDFNPKNVDVANGPATITQTISVTDSPAGVDFVQCYWESPSGAVSTTPISTTPSSGDRFNGVFECVQTIPQGAAPGVWTVFTLRLTDTVGNQAVYYTADLDALGFPTQLDVTYGAARHHRSAHGSEANVIGTKSR